VLEAWRGAEAKLKIRTLRTASRLTESDRGVVISLDDLLLKYSAAPKPVLISAGLQPLNHRTM